MSGSLLANVGSELRSGGAAIRSFHAMAPAKTAALFVRFETESGPGLHPRDRTLPFTPVLSGAILESKGIRSEMLELTAGKPFPRRIIRLLENFGGAAIFEVNVGQTDCVRDFLSVLSKRPDCIAAYGVFANCCPEAVLASIPDAYCITGEGESVIPQFVRWVSAGRKGEPPPGLKWLSNGNISDSGAAPPANTDDMPFVPAPILKSDRYRKNSFPLSIGRPLRWGFILANRGCLYNCTFCTAMTRQSIDRTWRLCSPERLAAEMKYQFEEVDRTIISIEDDLFTGDREWALKFCGLLGIEVKRRPWIMQTRIDCLDEELAVRLRRAGCVGVSFGIESGSDNVLKNLDKRVDAARIRETGKMLRKLGFAARCTAMIGSPGETREDFEKTAALVSELNPLIIQLAFCTAYPDTGLATAADRDGRLMRFEAPSRNLSDIGDADLVGLRLSFYLKYYFSLSYLRAHAREWLGYLLFNPSRALGQAGLFIHFMARQFLKGFRVQGSGYRERKNFNVEK